MSKVMNWMMDMEDCTANAAEEILSQLDDVTSKEIILSNILKYVKERMEIVDENFVKEYFEANIDDWRFEFNSKYI